MQKRILSPRRCERLCDTNAPANSAAEAGSDAPRTGDRIALGAVTPPSPEEFIATEAGEHGSVRSALEGVFQLKLVFVRAES